MIRLPRAILFGAILWVLIFVIVSTIIFLPFFTGKPMLQNIVYWIIEVPLVLAWAKWYFRGDPPSVKKGFLLALTAIVVGTILDLIITIPLFLVGDASFADVASDFYGDWALYVGFAILIASATFAGFEFDHTFTKAPKSMRAKPSDDA